jgi:hypothetical protein
MLSASDVMDFIIKSCGKIDWEVYYLLSKVEKEIKNLKNKIKEEIIKDKLDNGYVRATPTTTYKITDTLALSMISELKEEIKAIETKAIENGLAIKQTSYRIDLDKKVKDVKKIEETAKSNGKVKETNINDLSNFFLNNPNDW